jgi:hypothetical protein
MTTSTDKYWKLRLKNCKKALENNNFEVFLADNPVHAKEIVLEELLPNIKPETASWGDSLTLRSTGLLEVIKKNPDIHFIETFDKTVPRDEVIERRRQALLVDLFLAGTNAITATGKLVNLDMIGNRVAAITFGPQNVIIFLGRNKIVANIEEAMERIKNYAAPINAIRHKNFKIPCRETSYCTDCKSPDRICNIWSIIEKSFPKGRIKVVLINQDLGL